MFDVVLMDGYVVFFFIEWLLNIDLNGDGDMMDCIVYYYDLDWGVFCNFGVVMFGLWLLCKVVVFVVDE